MPAPLPDLEDDLLDQLTAFHENVTGITSVSKTPQANSLDRTDDLPHMTHLIGASTAIPTRDAAGRVILRRTIVARLLIWPMGTGEDVSGDGALANIKALPFYARLRNAYLRSPRLGTATQEEFAYLTEDLQFRDSGLVMRPGPGNVQYAAIDWTLDFTLRVPLPDDDYDDDSYFETAGLYDQFGLS